MKKTLVALTVAAFAASSAHAFTVYEKDGTKFDFSGRITLITDNVSTKVKGEKRDDKHTKMWNDGSRFRFDVKHQINEDLKGFAALEVRFDGSKSNGFGDAFAKRAYVGLDSATYGRVSIGKQLFIGDELGRIGLDNVYGVGTFFGDILTENADAGIEYTYTGIEGLKLSANYSFADNRQNKKDEFGREFRDEVNAGKLKSGFGGGAIYDFAVGEGTASVALGYSHRSYAEHGYKYDKDGVNQPDVANTSDSKEHNGVFGGVNYTINGFKVGVDYGFASHKTFHEGTNKLNYLRTGARYDFTETAGVYGNYSYQTYKYAKEAANENIRNGKDKIHRFMLGTDYKFHKNVITYLEGRVDRVNLATDTKYTDRYVGVGVSVRW